jgi:hypothetical protein
LKSRRSIVRRLIRNLKLVFGVWAMLTLLTIASMVSGVGPFSSTPAEADGGDRPYLSNYEFKPIRSGRFSSFSNSVPGGLRWSGID